MTVFDVDGVEVGSQEFRLDTAGFQQFAVGGFAGAVAIARAADPGHPRTAAAYSVVVDNVTGDSSLFTFEDLPAGRQDVLVNGVARANGRNNTFFRTDGRFYNPDTEDAIVSVAFHDNRGSNPVPVSRTFTVPAGRIRDVVDVLDSLLGLPVGSAGALRFTVGHARCDPLPHEQRGSGRRQARAPSARSRSPGNSSRSSCLRTPERSSRASARTRHSGRTSGLRPGRTVRTTH